MSDHHIGPHCHYPVLMLEDEVFLDPREKPENKAKATLLSFFLPTMTGKRTQETRVLVHFQSPLGRCGFPSQPQMMLNKRRRRKQGRQLTSALSRKNGLSEDQFMIRQEKVYAEFQRSAQSSTVTAHCRVLPQRLPNHLGLRDKGFLFRQIQWLSVIQVLVPVITRKTEPLA